MNCEYIDFYNFSNVTQTPEKEIEALKRKNLELQVQASQQYQNMLLLQSICAKPIKPKENPKNIYQNMHNIIFPIDPIQDYINKLIKAIDEKYKKWGI